jgi:hypothetical protein
VLRQAARVNSSNTLEEGRRNRSPDERPLGDARPPAEREDHKAEAMGQQHSGIDNPSRRYNQPDATSSHRVIPREEFMGHSSPMNKLVNRIL